MNDSFSLSGLHPFDPCLINWTPQEDFHNHQLIYLNTLGMKYMWEDYFTLLLGKLDDGQQSETNLLGSTLTNYPYKVNLNVNLKWHLSLFWVCQQGQRRIRTSDFSLRLLFVFALQSIDPLGFSFGLLKDVLCYGKHGPDRAPLREFFTSSVLRDYGYSFIWKVKRCRQSENQVKAISREPRWPITPTREVNSNTKGKLFFFPLVHEVAHVFRS